MLSVHGRQPVLALPGDVDLVARERVADLSELLDLGLEHLLEPLVFQLCALHLLLQLCGESGEVSSQAQGQRGQGQRSLTAGEGMPPATRAASLDLWT